MIELVGSFLFMLLNYVAFPILLWLFLVANNTKNTINSVSLLLFSLGLSPLFTSVLLYYSFMALPGLSTWFYFSLVICVYSVLGVFSYKKAIHYLTVYARSIEFSASINFDLKVVAPRNQPNSLLQFLRGLRITPFLSAESFLPIAAFVFFIGYLAIWAQSVVLRPLTQHDILEYAIQGKIFFQERLIEYVPHRFNESKHYYYYALHGFGFPLLKTWEALWNNLTGFTGDYFFRSISGYYYLLLYALLYNVLNRFIGKNAFLGILILLSSYGFWVMNLTYHIDSMRIFFLLLSLYLLYRISLKPTLKLAVLFGLTLGLMAFTHSIQTIIACLIIGSFLITIKASFGRRIVLTILVTTLFLAFGGIHYLLDTLLGTGWIFKAS